jgi:uncharacterized membrane protein YkgB
MNSLINALIKLGLLKEDIDYHLIRGSMIVLFLFFGYQKWLQYEAEVLIPYISNGPLLSWMYPGIRRQGSELVPRLIGVVLRAALVAGILAHWGFSARWARARRSSEPSTIMPFMPDGCAASAGGFPAMAGNVPFLMKDFVLFAASVYLLKQDVARAALPATHGALFVEGAGLKVTQ